MNEIVRRIVEEITKKGCAIVDVSTAIQVSKEGHLILSPVPTNWLVDQIALELEKDLEMESLTHHIL